jgi:hypothetical protein
VSYPLSLPLSLSLSLSFSLRIKHTHTGEVRARATVASKRQRLSGNGADGDDAVCVSPFFSFLYFSEKILPFFLFRLLRICTQSLPKA